MKCLSPWLFSIIICMYIEFYVYCASMRRPGFLKILHRNRDYILKKWRIKRTNERTKTRKSNHVSTRRVSFWVFSLHKHSWRFIAEFLRIKVEWKIIQPLLWRYKFNNILWIIKTRSLILLSISSSSYFC